jgi:RNA polymerase sigma-70 factor (ECF subfamily)
MDANRVRFEALFRQHYGAVVRYAVRRVGREAADEIVSETFLVAWRRLDQVPENALPWLFAAARKVAANELRRRERQSRLVDKATAHADAGVADHSAIVTESMRVQAAVDALSERDREVLRLSVWDDLSVRDGAQSLGCSAAAYKVRLHRARRRLAAYLGAPTPAQLVPEGEQA